MDADTQTELGNPADEDDDVDGPPRPSRSLPNGAPSALREAADTKPGTKPFADDEPEEASMKEAEALDFLLGAPHALMYDVPVQFDIEGGRTRTLTFVIKQLDGKRIMAIEDEHREGGRGPFSELDEVMVAAHLVAESTIKIQEKDNDGRVLREVDPAKEEFIGDAVTPTDAFRARFGFQSGILAALANQIRAISGYAPGKVGMPERPIRSAVSG